MSSLRRGGRQPKRWKEELLSEVVPGSELEWQIKHANSADLWTGVGQEEGIQIWRIVKFKVTAWPKEDCGKFHEEDAYIVLNSHRIHEKTRSLTHEIHFWIGKLSTPDKYGTAAYRTIDLYRHLHGLGKQHREVQGEESDMFKSYFTEIEILPGGSEPGFTHVQPVQYQHKLLHFKGAKSHIRVDEVKLDWSSLNSGDVFVLDLGLHIVQWNGKESNMFERHQAKIFVEALKSNRGGRPTNETIEEEQSTDLSDSTFFRVLPSGSGEIKSAEMGGDDSAVRRFEKQFYRIENKGNGVNFKHIKAGILSKEYLDQRYGYVLDTGFHVFFWIGKNTTQQIKARGFVQAKEYVEKSKHPFLPLTKLYYDQPDSEFDEAFTDARSSERNQQHVGNVLSKQELLALDHILCATSNKKVRDIRRDLQQSQSQGRDLTLEEITRSLKKAGMAALAKGLKENIEKDVENMNRYEAYQRAIQGEEKLKLKHLKFIYFGLPRSGKSSTLRRLIHEIISLKKEGGISKSTGVAETREVIIKRFPAAIFRSKQKGETSIWQSLIKSKQNKKQKGRRSKQMVCEADYRYLAQLFYHLTITGDKEVPEIQSPVFDIPPIQQGLPPIMSSIEATETTQPDLGSKQDEVATRLNQGAKDDLIELAYEQLNSILLSDSHEEFYMLLESLILLNIVDIGGQPSFVEMLPALTVGSSLYFLFFRMDQELRELYPVQFCASKSDRNVHLGSFYCIEDFLCQSLSSIAFFSSMSRNQPSQESVSRVLLFGTHKDRVVKKRLEACKFAINSTLWEKLSNIQPELLLRADKDNFFLVDNMNGNDEIDHICKEIENIVDHIFPSVHVPPSWLIFRIFLYLMDKPVVSLNQCQQIAAKIKMPASTSVENAVWYFHHHVGNLMHYPEVESIKDMVICDMQIIFDSISELIIDTFCVKNRAIPLEALRDFEDKGHFTLEHIKCSTRSHRSSYLSPEQLIDLLEYLNILAEIKPEQNTSPQRSNSEDSSPHNETLPQSGLNDLGSNSYEPSPVDLSPCDTELSSQVSPTYIIPAVLKCASEDELQPQASGSPQDQAYPLKIHFDCGFVPYGVFCGGVAYLIAHKDTLLPKWQLHNDFKVKKNKVVFLVDGTFDTVLISRPLNLEIQVYRHPVARQKKVITEICSSIRQTITEILETVIFKLKYKAATQACETRPFHLAFPCTCDDSDHLMKVIEDKEEIYSKCLRNDRELPLEEKHMVWFSNSVSEEHVHPRRGRILPVAHPQHSGTHLTIDDLNLVYNEVYDARVKWESIGLQLGISPNDLDPIKSSSRGDVAESLLEALKIFLNRAEPKPTWELLANALDSRSVNRGAMAQQLRIKYH